MKVAIAGIAYFEFLKAILIAPNHNGVATDQFEDRVRMLNNPEYSVDAEISSVDKVIETASTQTPLAMFNGIEKSNYRAPNRNVIKALRKNELNSTTA
ncbi:hypothetical protein [Pseudophaeobacter sp.]|uniref:hypothetical protein n=1 Tax=Pseudophaeobacter sp. TaxID=1971739 RepID=UPI003297E65D